MQNCDPLEVHDDNAASGLYVYESESEEEPYEYESDDDLVDAVMDDDTISLESSDEDDKLYKAWLAAFYTDVPENSSPAKSTSPIPITQNPTSDWHARADEKKKWEWCEHIAGPDCTSTGGYNGHRISLEEMRGCTSFQCLMEKRSDWQASEDDEDFEIESNYFLTGLGIDMPSRDENSPRVFPVRHGADEIQPEDWYIYALHVGCSSASSNLC